MEPAKVFLARPHNSVNETGNLDATISEYRCENITILQVFHGSLSYIHRTAISNHCPVTYELEYVISILIFVNHHHG